MTNSPDQHGFTAPLSCPSSPVPSTHRAHHQRHWPARPYHPCPCPRPSDDPIGTDVQFIILFMQEFTWYVPFLSTLCSRIFGMPIEQAG
ncbi:hypothetical protein N658DRAFT_43147 [Parathielavia hyrcaniae]|uniref:Uncharacterized protein n=1 Tax=Parathielavia hyrcaniae TaxID=113614 RepID=A0AAN6Q6N1_9PEZI|nr:hypothetical protein N658DRAFT_43147 [Parathielavia hyrcaniae]